jgi:hypothetical protein
VFSPASEDDPLGQFNANGIAVTPDGRYLIVVQTDTGRLFRISTASREVQEIDLGGERVTNGDGIVLQGRTRYVVRNASQAVSEVGLSGDLTRGRVVQTVTDPTFRFPTTAALAQGWLLLVNSQFNSREPGGLHGHVDQATLSETEGCGRPAAPAGRTGPRPVPAIPSTWPVIDAVGESAGHLTLVLACYTCPWNRRCSSRTSPASSGMGPRTGTPGAT